MAIPPVVTVYQWLRNKPGIGLMLSDGDFAPDKLAAANMESRPNLDSFMKYSRVRTLRSKRKVIDVELEESVWFDDYYDYAGLSDFIQFIHHQITEKHHHPLQVTLDYLLLHPTAASSLEKFSTLFAAWMASNPVDAIAWYEDEGIQEKLLLIHQETHVGLGKLLVEHYLQEARILFQSVAHPLGLIPLFAEHYDNPQRMVAFIIGLLEQKVKAGVIVKSGLLHEYLLGNIYRMGTDDNPVKQLYRYLDAFPIAKSLVKKAKTTSVKTAQGANETFINYALNGGEHSGNEPQALSCIQLSPISFDAVPKPAAFKTFHRLFGQRFLFNLLNYYRASQHADVKHVLEHQFNHLADVGLSAQELMQLLNELARENLKSLLRTMAELLDETTINTLIESGSFAIFHLIPFKPALFNKLNAVQVQRYIASIKTHDNPFDQLILLRTMLRQLKRIGSDEETTALLFDKIIHTLMTNPNLDDSRLIQVLKTVAATPNCSALLQQHAVALTAQLSQLIQGVITSEAGLTPDTSQDLTDAWRNLSRKMTVLKEISPDLAGDFPRDKYAFYISVVKAAVRAHEKVQSELKAVSLDYQIIPLNLQATLSNFFPVVEEREQLQNYPEDSISEYERTLIECLATMDNETLWAQTIQTLESSPINRLDWTAIHYGDNTIVELAKKQGNNPLIQYLLKENKLKSAAISRLLKIDIAAEQWDTVKQLIYLTQESKPDLESVSEALVAASKVNQLTYLLTSEAFTLQEQGFFQRKRQKIKLPIDLPVEPAPLLALLVAHGNEETIKRLFTLLPELLKSLVTLTYVTDYSNRIFTKISPFQYALWTMDWHMWDMMLDSLLQAFNEGYTEAEAIREEMLRQYKEVVGTHGVDYTLNGETIRAEPHFDVEPLINALDTYVNSFDSWDWQKREWYWCKVIGQLQRLVPVHIAKQYCDEKSFDDGKLFPCSNYSQSLKIYNFLSNDMESWFPLSRLGLDFAIYANAYGGGGAFGARAGPEQNSRGNLEALSVLCKVGTGNIATLGERLAIPLDNQDLETNYLACFAQCS